MIDTKGSHYTQIYFKSPRLSGTGIISLEKQQVSIFYQTGGGNLSLSRVNFQLVLVYHIILTCF